MILKSNSIKAQPSPLHPLRQGQYRCRTYISNNPGLRGWSLCRSSLTESNSPDEDKDQTQPPLLQSWDTPSTTEPPSSSPIFDEWANKIPVPFTAGNLAKQALAIIATITTVGIGTYLFQRKLSEYSKYRMETGHLSAVSIAAPTYTDTHHHHRHGDGYYSHNNGDAATSSLHATSDAILHNSNGGNGSGERIIPTSDTTISTTTVQRTNDDNNIQTDETKNNGNTNTDNNNNKQQQQQEQFEKYPLRTPEGQKALDRIRKIQERRRQLYDRAIARQEQHYEEVHGQRDSNSDSSSSSSSSSKRNSYNNNNKSQQQQQQQQSSSSSSTYLPSHPLYTDYDDDYTMDSSNSSESLPVGTSLQEMKERSHKANTAATQAAIAAQRATAASAIAADAAGNAVKAAHDAANAAAKCQQLLESKSLDSIETAYQHAIDAEQHALDAAKTAALAAAKATVKEHDAVHHKTVAEHAADLGMPHGVIEKVVYSVKRGRRGVEHAVNAVQGGVKSMVGEVVERGRAVGKGVVDGVEWLKATVIKESKNQ